MLPKSKQRSFTTIINTSHLKIHHGRIPRPTLTLRIRLLTIAHHPVSMLPTSSGRCVQVRVRCTKLTKGALNSLSLTTAAVTCSIPSQTRIRSSTRGYEPHRASIIMLLMLTAIHRTVPDRRMQYTRGYSPLPQAALQLSVGQS